MVHRPQSGTDSSAWKMINPSPLNDRGHLDCEPAVDLEDVDSHCRTTDRHGKHRRQTDAEHRRCACGKSTQRVVADGIQMLCPLANAARV
jgi:hypothetical protein